MAGPPAAWGIDVSTRAVALASYGDQLAIWPTVRFGGKKVGARRLADAYQQLHGWLLDASHWTPPDAVFVEQPTGRHAPPTLGHMVGVVLLTVAQVTDVPILTLPVPQWKAMSVGNGNASKPDVMAWARTVGYAGDDQDEADATGIAYAGHRILSRELKVAA